jgi:hypothetical protein
MLLCEAFVYKDVVILMFSFLYFFGAWVFALFLQLKYVFYNGKVVLGVGKVMNNTD